MVCGDTLGVEFLQVYISCFHKNLTFDVIYLKLAIKVGVGVHMCHVGGSI